MSAKLMFIQVTSFNQLIRLYSMFRKLFLIMLLFYSFQVHSQVGAGAGFVQWNTDWDDVLEKDDPTNSPLVFIDYWFRLRNKRVEFLPTVFFQQSNDWPYDYNRYGIQWNTNFYPLDFGDDCNCPTFSKQNETFKKGFFIQLSPELGVWNLELKHDDILDNDVKLEKSFQFSIGAGVGLDIGLSELITLTPIARYRYSLPLKWPELEEYPSLEFESESSIRSWEYLLRLGLRFDKKNYGYRRSRR